MWGVLQENILELKLDTERIFNGTKIDIKSNGQIFRTGDVLQISRGSRTIIELIHFYYIQRNVSVGKYGKFNYETWLIFYILLHIKEFFRSSTSLYFYSIIFSFPTNQFRLLSYLMISYVKQWYIYIPVIKIF